MYKWKKIFIQCNSALHFCDCLIQHIRLTCAYQESIRKSLFYIYHILFCWLGKGSKGGVSQLLAFWQVIKRFDQFVAFILYIYLFFYEKAFSEEENGMKARHWARLQKNRNARKFAFHCWRRKHMDKDTAETRVQGHWRCWRLGSGGRTSDVVIQNKWSQDQEQNSSRIDDRGQRQKQY